MKYQAHIAVTLRYSVEVEADSFTNAILIAQADRGDINANIAESARELVPEGYLEDYSSEVEGVYKLG